MNAILRPVALLIVLTCTSYAPHRLGFIPEAVAVIGVAPGGSVVRRHAVVGTAVVASSTANANAAATANANAAAAAPAGSPPAGTMVTTLPPGCVATTLNGVEYQRCGSTYYQAKMAGSNLVFVVAQP